MIRTNKPANIRGRVRKNKRLRERNAARRELMMAIEEFKLYHHMG